jgi:hypothetical protein
LATGGVAADGGEMSRDIIGTRKLLKDPSEADYLLADKCTTPAGFGKG